jgi:hypothetical protein
VRANPVVHSLAEVAVHAEDLIAWWELVSSEVGVDAMIADFLAVRPPVIIDVIEREESPLGLPAARADVPAVGVEYFVLDLSQMANGRRSANDDALLAPKVGKFRLRYPANGTHASSHAVLYPIAVVLSFLLKVTNVSHEGIDAR